MRASSTPTIASALSAQTSGQIAGCPAAIRVMSRKPPAARRSSAAFSCELSAASAISVAAVRCGHVRDDGHERVVPLGRERDDIGPEEETTLAQHAEGAADRCRAVGVSTQVAPTKASASAPSSPSCSEPAIGWPPMKRGSSTWRDHGRLDPADVGHDHLRARPSSQAPGVPRRRSPPRASRRRRRRLRRRQPSSSTTPISRARAVPLRVEVGAGHPPALGAEGKCRSNRRSGRAPRPGRARAPHSGRSSRSPRAPSR